MAAGSSSLHEYLKRYVSPDETKQRKVKKRRLKEKPKGKQKEPKGLIIVDDDPVWQKKIKEESEEEPDAEDGPEVIEDIEVKQMKRMEAVKMHKPYLTIGDDGSGWVPVKGPEYSGDLSPPRRDVDSRVSKNINEDLSPPRRGKPGDFGDLSPPRRDVDSRVSKIINEDLSPPRRGKPGDSGDLSPPRRVFDSRVSKIINEGLSPPRGGKPGDFGDLSPPRRDVDSRVSKKVNEDLSPPRRGKPRPSISLHVAGDDSLEKGLDKDLSPPRRRGSKTNTDAYLSPPRRHRGGDLSPPRKSEKKTFAGLRTKEQHKEEVQQQQHEIDPNLIGKGAQTVYRGKKLEELKKAQEAKAEEKPLEWGKGLAQKRQAEDRQVELEEEKSKPFARSRDDPELDRLLRDRERWGDPMAHLVKKKNFEHEMQDYGKSEEMKESGFIIPQDVPPHSWIKRGVPPPSNRYGIKPGRHWDGVDRSNGFEKEMFKKKNESKAREMEAYLWSVSDM